MIGGRFEQRLSRPTNNAAASAAAAGSTADRRADAHADVEGSMNRHTATDWLAAALAVGCLSAALPLRAHHSDAGLDMETVVTLDGTVTAYYFRNPHVYFTMETAGADGHPVEWSVQMGSAVSSSRQGWSRETLQAGDHVIVEAHPASNGRPIT